MTHWVYILKCKGGSLYVGETKRLFKRLSEHLSKKGCIHTGNYRPTKIMALYRLSDMKKHIKGQYTSDKHFALHVEYSITQLLMKKYKNSKKIDIGYNNTESFPGKTIKIPYCKCNLPASLHLYKGKYYWRCPKKNMKGYNSLFEYLADKRLRIDSKSCKFYNIEKLRHYSPVSYDMDIEIFGDD